MSLDLSQVRQQLPIYKIRDELISKIEKNSTLILLGETGCGKTTQIPQYLYESQLLNNTNMGVIACTQPRRVAAITVAQRVAAEKNSEIGTIVGYSVRFEVKTTTKTTKKFL
jgi:HrpA-like RNA helicase